MYGPYPSGDKRGPSSVPRSRSTAARGARAGRSSVGPFPKSTATAASRWARAPWWAPGPS